MCQLIVLCFMIVVEILIRVICMKNYPRERFSSVNNVQESNNQYIEKIREVTRDSINEIWHTHKINYYEVIKIVFSETI